MDAKDLSRAQADLTMAGRLDPTAHRPYYLLGQILLDRGDFDGALHAYEAAIRVKPDDIPSLHNAGVTMFELRRFRPAVQKFTRVIEIDPSEPSAWYMRGYLNRELGRAEQALADFEEALRLDPDDAAAASNIALLRAELLKRNATEGAEGDTTK